MAARPVRTSALARNQVITPSASSSACVLDGSTGWQLAAIASRRGRACAVLLTKSGGTERRRWRLRPANEPDATSHVAPNSWVLKFLSVMKKHDFRMLPLG